MWEAIPDMKIAANKIIGGQNYETLEDDKFVQDKIDEKKVQGVFYGFKPTKQDWVLIGLGLTVNYQIELARIGDIINLWIAINKKLYIAQPHGYNLPNLNICDIQNYDLVMKDPYWFNPIKVPDFLRQAYTGTDKHYTNKSQSDTRICTESIYDMMWYMAWIHAIANKKTEFSNDLANFKRAEWNLSLIHI